MIYTQKSPALLIIGALMLVWGALNNAGAVDGLQAWLHNKHDGVFIIVDNYYTSATGGQDILSSRATSKRRDTNNSIVQAVKGIGGNGSGRSIAPTMSAGCATR